MLRHCIELVEVFPKRCWENKELKNDSHFYGNDKLQK